MRNNELMDTKDIAQRIGRSEGFVRRLMRSGVLDGREQGHRFVARRRDVERYMAELPTVAGEGEG